MRKNRVQMFYNKPSRTKQSEGDSACLTKIIDKINRSGFDPYESRKSLMRYFDVSSVPSFEEGMNIVVEASRMFDTLPSKVRSAFDNDVSKLGAFLEKASDDELVAVGLLKKMPSSDPVKPVKEPAPQPVEKPVENPPADTAGDRPA